MDLKENGSHLDILCCARHIVVQREDMAIEKLHPTSKPNSSQKLWKRRCQFSNLKSGQVKRLMTSRLFK
jgi:hypothetical protein